MNFRVTLPSLGDENDAVRGAVVSAWLVEVGATLKEGDDLLEVTTDKAAFVVPTPSAGVLVERVVAVGDTVSVGDLLALLGTS